MKKIQDILEKKKTSPVGGKAKNLDEKTIIRVFLEASKEEVKNLQDNDIREIKLKDKTLYIKTAHPVVSSELLLRRDRIIERANQIAGREVIEKIFT